MFSWQSPLIHICTQTYVSLVNSALTNLKYLDEISHVKGFQLALKWCNHVQELNQDKKINPIHHKCLKKKKKVSPSSRIQILDKFKTTVLLSYQSTCFVPQESLPKPLKSLTFSSRTYRIVFLVHVHALTVSTSGQFEQNLGRNAVKKVAGVYNKSML